MLTPPLYVVKTAAVGRHDELKAAEAGMDKRGMARRKGYMGVSCLFKRREAAD
jgi:hypothetical protein